MNKNSRHKEERAANRHLDVLVKSIGEFLGFLGKKPKPTDDEVRAVFLNLDKRWRRHCIDNRLGPRAYLLFNREIARMWRSGHTKTLN